MAGNRKREKGVGGAESESVVSRFRGSTQASCRRFRIATVGENERLGYEVVVKDLSSSPKGDRDWGMDVLGASTKGQYQALLAIDPNRESSQIVNTINGSS
jgi:hypothetical protein